jgi:Glycosyl hydrolase family 57
MKFIIALHANLNYSHLKPERRNFVCTESYGRIADLFNKEYPDSKWCFEASGFTMDHIAANTPDVLDKLRESFGKNCEFVGSPYAHSILTNFPYEDGCKALQFAMETYQKHLGFTPTCGWNPEGAWRKDIPDMFKESGFESIIIDWDSYMRTMGLDEWESAEKLMEGDERFIAINEEYGRFLYNPVNIIPGLKGISRTDRVSLFSLKYFLGEIELKELLDVIDFYSQKDGCLIVFAEDCEYVGTTAWYYLKYKNEYRMFEENPGSIIRLAKLVEALEERGELSTPSEVLRTIPAEEETVQINDGLAWHHQEPRFWAETPSALTLDKECDRVRELIRKDENEAVSEEQKEKVKKAWWYLVQAENSDGRWPMPPKNPADFNVAYCEDMLTRVEQELK